MSELSERTLKQLKTGPLKVYALLAISGLTNKEIGLRLGYSESVVKNYTAIVYQATGMSNARELMVFTYGEPDLIEALRDIAQTVV